MINLNDSIVDWFGTKMIICPHQLKKCQHQFPAGDGAFLSCDCDECYETLICKAY